MFYLLLPFLISLTIFLAVMITEPRSMFSGITCLTMLVAGLATLFFVLILYGGEFWFQHPMFHLLLITAAVLMIAAIAFFPIYSIIFLFYEGVKNIRKEGVSIPNILLLCFSIGLFVYIFIWPFLLPVALNFPWKIIHALYYAISAAVGYLLAVLIIYCFSAVLNLIHPAAGRKLDAIIVLGSGIFGETVPPLLKGRINKGIELLNKNPGAVLILSGGQGKGEDIPESVAMGRYAISQGVDPGRILLEQNSLNTEQNLLYSSELFPENTKRIAIVTTNYHVFRALLLAKSLKIPAKGFGSGTKWYFALNAMLREFAGYIRLTWKMHAVYLAILILPFFLIILFF